MIEPAATDWNAADAATAMPRPGLAARLRAALLKGRAALRERNARPGTDDEVARATNIVAALAASSGITQPAIWVMDGEPNALVVRGDPSVIALTRSLLERFTRTELEAVLAHCVVRLSLPKRAWPIGYADDVRAAALTRFPPALADALLKVVPEEGRFAPLYLAGTEPFHRSAPERAAALEDL